MQAPSRLRSQVRVRGRSQGDHRVLPICVHRRSPTAPLESTSTLVSPLLPTAVPLILPSDVTPRLRTSLQPADDSVVGGEDGDWEFWDVCAQTGEVAITPDARTGRGFPRPQLLG